MPMPNSTTTSSVVSEASTLKPKYLARSARTDVDRAYTRPIEATGRAPAMGLRKIRPSNTTISTMVTIATILVAESNDCIVS